ncbi:hypothetical protein SUNI508_10156 [Seiridium unicorne]|uniref:Heterokaryon incompatibility domain-containing protein n=1 Tax=Seiridium unicorne TaxID=138068 RepID=A0ABR2UMG0_9PEZI
MLLSGSRLLWEFDLIICLRSSYHTAMEKICSEASVVHISPDVLHRVLEGVSVASKASADLTSLIAHWITITAQSFADCGGPSDTLCWTTAKWLFAAHQQFEKEQQKAMQLVNIILAVAFLRERRRAVGSDTLAVDITLAWSLIYEALTSGEPICNPSRSAQGFLSVALCSLIKDGSIEELWRFHVWLPDGKRGNTDFALHSHQPFAESWILAGEAIDHSYAVTPAVSASTATHAMYRLSWNDGKTNGSNYKTHQTSSNITNTGELVSTTLTQSEAHGRNSNYTIPSGAHHRTEVKPDEVHATIFVFDSSRGFQKDAPVLGPIAGEASAQQRDPEGVTTAALAKLVGTLRSWEESVSHGRELAYNVEWEGALQWFQNALHRLDSHQGIQLPHQYRIRTLIELGNVNRRFGRYEQAQQYLISALRDMEPSMERAELSGELGVVYRHMNKLLEAKKYLEEQYTIACNFNAIRSMCRAIGNLGMVNYQLFMQDGGLYALNTATRQLLLRVQLARGIKSSITLEPLAAEIARQHMRSAITWETIGLARLSLCYGAQGDIPKAIASAKESLEITKGSGDATVIAMSRFFYGRALLLAGRTHKSEAMEQFNQKGTCTPVMAFCKEPSKEHYGYLEEMINAGADLDTRDEQGYTALDYAVFSGDLTTEALIAEGLRKSFLLSEIRNAESEVSQRRTEAYVRKGYREILQESLRPILLRINDRAVLSDVRNTYANTLASDPQKRMMFDQLKFIHYKDFVRAERLPRSSDKLACCYSTGTAQSNTADYLIFFSYRWINTRPTHHGHNQVTHSTPDDDQHTQYRRMLIALDEFLIKHPQVDSENLGLWMDFACIDQDDPISGVQTLPLIIVQCDAIISLVDETYYSRAWCSVEVLYIQTLRKAYGRHLWYEQVAVGTVQDNDGFMPKYALRVGDVETEIVLTEKKLTYQSDEVKIAFLDRQVRLLI